MKKLMLSQFISIARHCSTLLQRCMKPKALKSCKQIHAFMLTNRIHMNVLSLSSKLIGAYACCGDLISSGLLLRETTNPNVFAFNWMILESTQSGLHKEAFRYFSLSLKSRNNNSSPNKYTFSAILKCCVYLLEVELGNQVFGLICKMGFLNDLQVCNSLIDMYANCSDLCRARQLFDTITERDVASWTIMISGYADIGKINESVFLLERMRLQGYKPNEFTWNAIITGHSKNGDCDGALRFFSLMGDEALVPDTATWNTMISGFIQNDRAFEALTFFRYMLISGIKPNQVTLSVVLPACGMIASVRIGKEIHGFLYRMELEINAFVASSLIDMYSKCGSIKGARRIFDSIPQKNLVSWNAMVGCYGKHGMVNSAIELFENMLFNAVQPNEVTFTSVLSACSHGGLVEKGIEIFKSMDSYSVRVNSKHYSCLIDLLCRCGRMEEAYGLIIDQSGEEITSSSIGAFLSGCKVHGRRDLAEKIYERGIRMDKKRPEGLVTLANIYATEGEWGGVEDVRRVMKDSKVVKKHGFSSI